MLAEKVAASLMSAGVELRGHLAWQVVWYRTPAYYVVHPPVRDCPCNITRASTRVRFPAVPSLQLAAVWPTTDTAWLGLPTQWWKPSGQWLLTMGRSLRRPPAPKYAVSGAELTTSG